MSFLQEVRSPIPRRPPPRGERRVRLGPRPAAWAARGRRATVRRPSGPGAAVDDQLDTEVLFEYPDLTRDRCLRHSQTRSGTPEMQLLAQCEKSPEVSKFHRRPPG